MTEATDLAHLVDALRQHRLLDADEEPRFTRLTGGVSSDIWRVDARRATFCIKRALGKLKVAADWHAPVSRNAAEAAWLRCVATWLPHAVPALLFEDAPLGCFAMAYLPAEHNPVWKAKLLKGEIDDTFAAQVGFFLAQIHERSAGSAALAAQFANHDTFESIRIEPYLRATAARHPDLANTLGDLADSVSAARIALVHGDVSPKNILCGADGPVFLDAECATFGDPAFDLAFCLNHLVLKSFLNPHWRERYAGSFDALSGRYLAAVDWEPAERMDLRCARLLPALLLARVDGKSPVEYLQDPAAIQAVRELARGLLIEPVDSLAQWRKRWNEAASIDKPAGV
ncbi:aminoglycoside phosphotransferase family protein [Caballeronia sp. GAWG2-1]|uniref:phosphotransferase family protein n=1 Tax=Caballeronia sp. GAWG2-1 TaxID=2921744 RepID=UPI002027FC12|nr:aminoglycoside phosphotransferase family protein [Caballeronia sp. GAWG2-1]